MRSAFTLLEVITVVAIVAIVAAISYPVWISAKERGLEALTRNDLRQAYIALELYRSDHDGGGVFVGASSQLGLPNRDQFSFVLRNAGIQWGFVTQRLGYGPIYYPFDPSDVRDSQQRERWLRRWTAYNEKFEASSVMVGDFHHTRGCGYVPSFNCLFNGFGVTLDGQLRRKRALGDTNLADWWE